MGWETLVRFFGSQQPNYWGPTIKSTQLAEPYMEQPTCKSLSRGPSYSPTAPGVPFSAQDSNPGDSRALRGVCTTVCTAASYQNKKHSKRGQNRNCKAHSDWTAEEQVKTGRSIKEWVACGDAGWSRLLRLSNGCFGKSAFPKTLTLPYFPSG